MAIETVDIHGKAHPTYAGILNEAHDKGLVSIQTKLLQAPLKKNNYMAIVHAEVTMGDAKIFHGIGDATPKNVNQMIAPHIVRMAETRAKGRALRDALNIAEALLEEMGDINDSDADWLKEGGGKEPLKCDECGAPAMLKSGTSKSGKPYNGVFCTKDKEHVKWM